MEKAEQRFSIKSIEISRGYSENTPFTAKIGVRTSWDNDMTITLPEDRVLQIIDVVGDLVTAALIGQVNNMREDHVAAIEAKRQEALPPPVAGEVVE
jgi:hypothetical protein